MGHSRLAFILVVLVFTTATWGQSNDNAGAASVSSPVPTPTPVVQAPSNFRPASDSPTGFLRNIGQDQKDIWTSPFKGPYPGPKLDYPSHRFNPWSHQCGCGDFIPDHGYQHLERSFQ